MGKSAKKTTKNSIKTESFCQSTENIDYNMLVKAIVEAKFAYVDAEKKRKTEIRMRNRMKAFTGMGIAKYFDKNGKKKDLKRSSEIYMCLKTAFSKEKHLAFLISDMEETQGNGILSDSVSAFVYVVFLLIEWFFYALSVFLVLKPFVFDKTFNFGNAPCILVAIASFVAGTIVRLHKIDCKYNNDKNYMLNFLALIIAVVALIVSIFVR